MLPLNFGPLNSAGGERRLNVAITRARRQVIVFSSFDPDELRAEQTSARGIKDLRAYLELAAAGTRVLESLTARPARPSAVDRHADEIADGTAVARVDRSPARGPVGLQGRSRDRVRSATRKARAGSSAGRAFLGQAPYGR